MLLLEKRLTKVLLSLVILLQIALLPISGMKESQVASAADRTFKIAVLPDTQMYSRHKPEIYNSQTEWIKKYQYSENIVFTTHLGDIVDQSTVESEWKSADEAMKILDDAGAPYGYTAGNHDIAEWLDDDSRDDNDKYNKFFNQYFKPATRMINKPGYQGSSPKGYSSYYTFKGAGKTFLVMFIDWRAGAETIKWANQVMKDNADKPTILATHQLLNIESDGKTAVMTENGQYLWDELIKSNDQIFLTLNGHHHGTAQMVKKNDKGHDVFMSVIDYQGYYMGGNGIMRTMEFNLDAGTISAKTFSPWVMNMPLDTRDETYDLEEINDANNKFIVNMNFNERFKGIWDSQNRAPQASDVNYNIAEGKTLSAKLKATDPDVDKLTYSIVSAPSKGTVKLVDASTGSFLYTAPAGATGNDTFTFKANDGFVDSEIKTVTINVRSASDGNGEVAHWKFEKPADGSFNVKDLSGNGNDLHRVDLIQTDVPDIDMKWTDDKSPFSKSKGSLEISSHGKMPQELSYLRTDDDAPLNAMTFQNGYTIEAYFRINSNFDGNQNGWMGMLGRGGTGADGGKTDGDREEPLATLSISNLKQLQWAAYPDNLDSLRTNWSGEMFFDWIHVAVVNDTKKTKMYVNGSPVLTNDEGPNSIGLATAQKNGKFVPWIVGAYHYNNVFEKAFNGAINEIRITNRPLDLTEFLMNDNEIPVSKDLSVMTDQNKAYSGKLLASDLDMNPLTYQIVAQPTNGSLSVDKETGDFVYTPIRDYNGADQFTYRVYDGKVYSNDAHVSVTVNKNHTPKALDHNYTVAPGKELSGMMKAEDTDGDKLSFELLKQPGKGTVELTDASTGTFKYVPTDGQTGLDYFTYRVTDGKNESLEAVVIIEITANAPSTGDWTASNLEYTVRQGGTINGTFSDAVDKNERDNVLEISMVSLPEKGQVTVTEATYGSFVYKADSAKTGTDVLTFQISDGIRRTNTAYALIHIEPNNKPVAANLQLQMVRDKKLEGGQMKASDGDKDTLTFTIVTQPESGKLTVTDAVYGYFNYEPNAGFTGEDKFTYKVNDGISDSNTAEVKINVHSPSGSDGGGGGSNVIQPTPKPPEKPTVPPVTPEKPATEPPAAPVKFEDLSDHWAKGAVEKLSALNVINGYPDQTFKPEKEMTRAEFVVLLVKALQLKGTGGPSFSDLNGHWAEEAVQTAATLGIIQGVNDSTFAPKQKITREQMAVILVRALKLKTENEEKTKFVDQSNVSAWAVSSLNTLVGQGIIKGYEDGSFRPDKAMNRGEAASVIVKLMDMQAKQ
ncbi:Ig-like domain-containing protein [Paenibacillus sp. PL91]|uniref:Ig-like domain-containing protein n=1 Tax=Paenibacillus sp. PL91 TaxID=2729538 RepID=UPI00145EBBDC|nr:Ig-like domain-containing protein [Paenibacillus sp. PL91]MBC9201603.1 tandem-95 repeat protein [Paenibacillus sp. PL91]